MEITIKNKGGRPKKDRFAALPDDWKEKAKHASKEEIREMFAKVGHDEATNRAAQKADQDLQEKKEAAREANAVYAEGTKVNRLKLDFLKEISDSFPATPGEKVQLTVEDFESNES